MITAELVLRAGAGAAGGSTENAATGNSVARERTTLAAKSGRMRLNSIYASQHCGNYTIILKYCLGSCSLQRQQVCERHRLLQLIKHALASCHWRF
jgi:hypothetical protein